MAKKINIFKQYILIIAMLFASIASYAFEPIDNEQEEGALAPIEHQDNKEHESVSFDAGKMIMEHVSDSHSWHLFGHTEIPLPIIIYNRNTGNLDVFLSTKFEHGTKDYNGYKLEENQISVAEELGLIPEGTIESEKTSNTEGLIDLSITKNVAAMLISMLLMLWIFISIAKSYAKNPGKAPRGLQSFVEPLIIFVRDDVAKPSIGDKRYEKFMPFLLTVFFFILINNYLGLIPFFPGGVNLTGSISIAMVLALFTLGITFIYANKHYWRHVFAMPGVPIPVLIILTPIEILGLFLRPFVLMIRLFANITAGHIIALAFFSLIFIFGEINAGLGFGVSIFSLVFTIFMGFLELLVAFLQAYVFTLLSAIYFGSAVDEGHDVHNHADDHAVMKH
jgi:F-type H+-transporting ATPase subunit a